MAEIAEVVIGESLLSHLDSLFACGFFELKKKSDNFLPLRYASAHHGQG
jgi:hypothetical protein